MFQTVGMGNNFYTDSLGMQSACFANPYMSNCNTAIAANSGYNYGYSIGMTQRIQSLLQTIVGAIQQLSQALQNPDLTADEKRTIQGQIEKLQKLAKQVQAGLANLPTPEQMAQVERAVGIAIQNAVQQAQQLIQSHASTSTDSSDSSDSTDDTSSTSSSSDNTEVSDEAAKKAKEEQEKQKTEALEIISGIYSATEGCSKWGWLVGNSIDYPKLRESAKKINKDNVANIIVYWEEQHAQSTGKSIIKALFDGEKGWNPSLHGKDQNTKNSYENANNMDVLWNMTICLKEKAKELGIYNDVAGQFDVAFDELDDTCVDEEAVDNALKAIAAAIFTKQTEKLAESAQQTVDDTTQADNQRNAAQRKEEVIAQKKQEFQNALRRAYDLGDRLPELTAGFKVITDDNGEFKEYEITIPGYTPFKGSSLENIVAQLEEYDIDPKKALVKRVDTRA